MCLRTYLPDRAAEFDAARARSLERIPQGPGRDAGIAVGEAAAVAVMASRENDGSETPESFLPDSANPGEWQLTRGCPPEGGVFLHWRKVKPFVIQHVEHFRSAPPPPLNSWRYARAYAEVKAVGARDSKQRPADRTTVAQFYNHYGDAGLWNPVARQLAKARRQTLAENARTFALLNLALHDLTIALVETKYHYHFWRPETAIPAGGTDGNEHTEPDASYVPLIETPCHPSYGSGHAATSGAAREVLERAFGASRSQDRPEESRCAGRRARVFDTRGNYRRHRRRAGVRRHSLSIRPGGGRRTRPARWQPCVATRFQAGKFMP